MASNISDPSNVINFFVALGTCAAVLVALIAKKQSSVEATFSLLLSQHNQSLQSLKSSKDYQGNINKVIDAHSILIERDSLPNETKFIDKQNEVMHEMDDFYGSYFRILYHIIKFIDSDAGYYPLDFERKKKYTSLVRAHMDSEITYLLAINCAHAKPGGQYYSYKILIERYSLLEHLIFNKSFLGKYYHPDLQNRSQKDLRLINCQKKHTPLGEIAIRYNDNAFGCNPDRIDFL
ncbi:putative phage abortive infection protein [Atlantibacter subterranea]|uniref:putative phage abortive infection protein n=1 Tax=Atlantibacter subterraneus TaxID=255519 RepID=UPI0020C1F88D|nr:putative phage abortive infection protein [Atlantibacter subterranea]UTJ48425.1 putative phage abortive infection protein [Atlantibacter subterranea]